MRDEAENGCASLSCHSGRSEHSSLLLSDWFEDNRRPIATLGMTERKKVRFEAITRMG
jgi:hypothetical protein